MELIFSRNNDYNKTAFINWAMSKNNDIQNILVIAEGFMKSSIELAKLCLKDNSDKKADIFIFPIFNNANHAIELYLKAIIWTLNKVNKSEDKFNNTHDIKELFDIIEIKLKSCDEYFCNDSFSKVVEELKTYIDELYKKNGATVKNSKMEFSRYPFNKKFENYFYLKTNENVVVDLEKFVTTFEIIGSKLDQVSYFLYDQVLHHEW